MKLTLENITECTRCPLRITCNQVVPGVGPLNAKLMLVGEAPGEDEDLEGEPFVGRSGQLLSKLLKDAGLDRTQIYVSNTVKCRPPKNRTPSPKEIDVCKIWLWKEIQRLLEVQVIAPLGATATQLLLKLKTVTMANLVGRSFSMSYTKAKLMPWYHPSYLIRNNNQKLLDKTVDWLKQIKENLCGSGGLIG